MYQGRCRLCCTQAGLIDHSSVPPRINREVDRELPTVPVGTLKSGRIEGIPVLLCDNHTPKGK